MENQEAVLTECPHIARVGAWDETIDFCEFGGYCVLMSGRTCPTWDKIQEEMKEVIC